MLNDAFHYRNNALFCEAVPLDTLADSTGTPVYVYSAARIAHNVDQLRAAFDPLGATIHYSLKANANLALLRLRGASGSVSDR